MISLPDLPVRSSAHAVVLALGLLGGGMTAEGCPLCDTPGGQQVRAGIFNDEFGLTVLTVLTPFAVVLIAFSAILRALPAGRETPASVQKR